MTVRRTASSIALALTVGLVPVLSGSPAVARWNIHNDADVTQMTAPPGGTEDQTCSDRLRGETGWSAFTDQDPATFVIPPEAYGPSSYTVWKAPPGFADFNLAQAEFDDVTGEVIGYAFFDTAGNQYQATRLLQFTTANRTAVPAPIPIDVTADGGLYVFTTAPISVSLPYSVAPGDAIGLLPPGGSTILDLAVVDCTPSATGTSFSAVKGVRFTRTVAKFTGPGDISDYRASIRWGDGTNRSAGTISPGLNGFLVKGTHKYRQRGSYLIHVRITQIPTGIVVRTLSNATVASTT